MRMEINSNVTPPAPPTTPEPQEVTSDMELQAVEMSCERASRVNNLILGLLFALMTLVIFTVRWVCFIEAFSHAEEVLKLPSLGNMTKRAGKDFENVWRSVEMFGFYFFAIEVVTTIIVFTHTILVYKYIVDKTFKIKTSLLNHVSLMLATCGFFSLQFVFFQIHEFVFVHFAKLGAQTRLTIFFTDLLGEMRENLQEVTDYEEGAGFIEFIRGRIEAINHSFSTGVFSKF